MKKKPEIKTRGSEQREPTKLPENIKPEILKWLRKKNAIDSEIEIYLFILKRNDKGNTVRNADVGEACNMHHSTVVYHTRNMIKKGLMTRTPAGYYTAKVKK